MSPLYHTAAPLSSICCLCGESGVGDPGDRSFWSSCVSAPVVRGRSSPVLLVLLSKKRRKVEKGGPPAGVYSRIPSPSCGSLNRYGRSSGPVCCSIALASSVGQVDEPAPRPRFAPSRSSALGSLTNALHPRELVPKFTVKCVLAGCTKMRSTPGAEGTCSRNQGALPPPLTVSRGSRTCCVFRARPPCCVFPLASALERVPKGWGKWPGLPRAVPFSC